MSVSHAGAGHTVRGPLAQVPPSRRVPPPSRGLYMYADVVGVPLYKGGCRVSCRAVPFRAVPCYLVVSACAYVSVWHLLPCGCVVARRPSVHLLCQ